MTSRPQPRDVGVRSRMQATPRRDTSTELVLRTALHALGLRYRVDWPLPGSRRRADLAFPRQKVAVFVDGCFWHGCPRHMTWPQNNAEWWREKIEANRARDRNTNRRLRRLGWSVVRVWEHEPVAQAVIRVSKAVRPLSEPALRRA